jgi:hypothetical protein
MDDGKTSFDRCPSCNIRISNVAEMIGKRVHCKSCNCIFRISASGHPEMEIPVDNCDRWLRVFKENARDNIRPFEPRTSSLHFERRGAVGKCADAVRELEKLVLRYGKFLKPNQLYEMSYLEDVVVEKETFYCQSSWTHFTGEHVEANTRRLNKMAWRQLEEMCRVRSLVRFKGYHGVVKFVTASECEVLEREKKEHAKQVELIRRQERSDRFAKNTLWAVFYLGILGGVVAIVLRSN